MGCDIHTHIEVKLVGDDSDTWHHFSTPRVTRNYEFFSYMADNEWRWGTGRAVVPERGIPADASPVTLACYKYDEGDAHSTTWISCEEIPALRKAWTARQDYDPTREDLEHHIFRTYLCGNSLTDVRGKGEYPEDNEGSPFSDVRFVYWFDN